MKIIILAAGRGSRLNKYTEVMPKGMLPLNGKPILQYQIECLRKANITNISIVTGFNSEKINFKNIKYYNNSEWANTNMVASLFCAEKEFDGSDDILVSYADTIYEPAVFELVMNCKHDLAKVIDIDYKEYWVARNGDYKIDSESCTLNQNGSIKEIGEEGVTDDARLMGRDTGLTFISKEFAPKVLEYWKKIKETHWDVPFIHSKSVRKINMTDFLQGWIDNNWIVHAEKIKRGWMEFDTNEDYENAITWEKSGNIKKFINLELLEK